MRDFLLVLCFAGIILLGYLMAKRADIFAARREELRKSKNYSALLTDFINYL